LKTYNNKVVCRNYDGVIEDNSPAYHSEIKIESAGWQNLRNNTPSFLKDGYND